MKKQTAVLMVFSLFVFALLSAFVSCAHAQGFKGGAFAPVAGGSGSTSLTSTTILNASRPNYLVYDSAGVKLTTSSRMRRADDSAFVIDNPTGGAKFSFVTKQAGTVKVSIDSVGKITTTNNLAVGGSSVFTGICQFGGQYLQAVNGVNNSYTTGFQFGSSLNSATSNLGVVLNFPVSGGSTGNTTILKIMPSKTGSGWGSGTNRLISAGTFWNSADHEYFAVDTTGSTFGTNFKITKEGGYAVWVTSNSTISAGYICMPDTGTGYDVKLAAAGTEVPTGVAYTGGITSTGGWMVVSGVADVLFDSTATRAGYAVVLTSSGNAGKAVVYSAISSPNHDRECGHALGSVTANSTQRVVLHFR